MEAESPSINSSSREAWTSSSSSRGTVRHSQPAERHNRSRVLSLSLLPPTGRTCGTPQLAPFDVGSSGSTLSLHHPLEKAHFHHLYHLILSVTTQSL